MFRECRGVTLSPQRRPVICHAFRHRRRMTVPSAEVSPPRRYASLQRRLFGEFQHTIMVVGVSVKPVEMVVARIEEGT